MILPRMRTMSPLRSEPLTFTASLRQHLTVKYEVSPFSHSPLVRFSRRGVEPTRISVTGVCVGVGCQNLGSAVTNPRRVNVFS